MGGVVRERVYDGMHGFSAGAGQNGRSWRFQGWRMGGMCGVIWAGILVRRGTADHKGYSINDFNYRRNASSDGDSHGK